MNPIRILLLIAALAPQGAGAANSLQAHPSPYLALHAEDPVDWRTWQPEVFASARATNRLIFVSIGYFSCHWCHVMQRESFRNAKIAALLNADFIAVKVDRELNPDLDRRMIEFVEKIRGSAGWPLNVFLTPEGYPLTGFTYLPAEQFRDVVDRLRQQWRQNHARFSAAAKQFFDREMQDRDNRVLVDASLTDEQLQDAFLAQLMLTADDMNGGIGDTSKFPNVPQIDTLLEIIGRQTDIDPEVVEFARLTLDAMAAHNLQDHVRGGFFRYTTDPDWQTPHYEKMLYDNAQLAGLYFKAESLWPGQGYAGVAGRTLEFIERELAHDEGAYVSSLSAVDDNDREGGGYRWTRRQLTERLGEADAAYLASNGFIAADDSGDGGLLAPLDKRADPARNQSIRQRLLRSRPTAMPADHKRLAAWNAMLLSALLDGVDFDPRLEPRTKKLYRDMRRLFFRDGELLRLAGGTLAVAVTFEDYAQVAHAFHRYGLRYDDDTATLIARRLTEVAHSRFLQNDRWQRQASSLIPMDRGQWIVPDLVYFSPMTLWLRVATRIADLDPAVRRSARQMLQRASSDMLDSPYFYGSFILLRILDPG